LLRKSTRIRDAGPTVNTGSEPCCPTDQSDTLDDVLPPHPPPEASINTTKSKLSCTKTPSAKKKQNRQNISTILQYAMFNVLELKITHGGRKN